MATIIDDFLASISALAGGNPLLVVFLTSLAGNLVPFFPVPYLLFVIGVASTFQGISLVQVATVGALGAAIGKFVIYLVGYGAGTALSGRRARFDSLRKLLGGSAFLAAFIFAASPFPDDVIFIPLGIMRYSPTKTFISLFSGKFVLTFLVAYLARSSSRFVETVSGGSPFATGLSVAVVIIISIVMMRVDWEKFLARRQNGLVRRTLRRMRTLIRRPGRKPEAGTEHDPSTDRPQS